MDLGPAPYSPQLRAVLANLDREVRTFDLRLAEATWSDTSRELFDRLCDLEAECSAQRTEISRLHGRLRRVEDELNQGRGWLAHLSDRLFSLEQSTQRISSSLRALATSLRDTLAETVARLRILF